MILTVTVCGVGEGEAVAVGVADAVAAGDAVTVVGEATVGLVTGVVAPGNPVAVVAKGTVRIIVASTSGATGVPSGSISSTEKTWAPDVTLFHTTDVCAVDWNVPATVVAWAVGSLGTITSL